MFKKLGWSKKQSLTLLRLLKTLDCKKQLRTSRLPKLILRYAVQKIMQTSLEQNGYIKFQLIADSCLSKTENRN